MPQCAVIGWPGQTGHASAAASSQTVKTKSSLGASGRANSVQLLERKLADVVVQLAQKLERIGMDAALGMASGRVGAELAAAFAIQDGLGHDRARRVAGAEKENVERLLSRRRRIGYLLRWLLFGAGAEQADSRDVS